MTTVILCEKPDQAKALYAVFATSQGTIVPAAGHLLRLAEPEEVNPNWKIWGTDVLAPPGLRYPHRIDPKRKSFLDKIGIALKGASTVILATDPDREGQMIGQEILDHFRYRGQVKRVIYNAVDPTSLKQAFAKASDNSKYQPLYEAALARANADQIYNLTLTRTATKMLAGADRRVIGIGRVKTATLALVARRYLAIKNFIPKAFFEIGLDITDGTNAVRLWHKRAHDNLLIDRLEADAIASGAKGFRGPITVARKRAIQAPPKPHSLTSLTSAVGKKGIKNVLEIAQALYDEHKITTYPRSDVRYLPESMAPDAAPIIAELLRHQPFDSLKQAGFGAAIVRKGKNGSFSDKDLKGEPHHAIIPNINMIAQLAGILPKLSANERTVFDEIARAYLAATGPDHTYDQTDLSIEVPIQALQKPVRFARIGRVTVSLGWKAAYGANVPDEDEDDDQKGALPPFVDGATVQGTNSEIVQKSTQPPKLIRLTGLPQEMAEVWKEIPDPGERDRLKEAKGIGQTSTREEIIRGLLRQSLIADIKGNAEPTQAGLELYLELEKIAPVLNDPGATARMEFQLDEIVEGKRDYQTVLSSIVAQTTTIRDIIVTNGKAISGNGAAVSKAANGVVSSGRKPTPSMISFAKNIAQKSGSKLPSGALSDFAICKAYLDKHAGPAKPPAPQGAAPASSPTGGGAVVSDPAAASPAQIKYMESLIKNGAKAPAGWPQRLPTKAEASSFIDKAVKKK